MLEGQGSGETAIRGDLFGRLGMERTGNLTPLRISRVLTIR
jgi:hypothetical protein